MKFSSTTIKALIVFKYLTVSTIAEVLSHIHVKVTPGTNVNDIQSSMDNVVSIHPLFTLPAERLKELSSAKPNLPDLTLWHDVVVKLPDVGVNVAKVEEDLNTLSNIENVIISEDDAPPPPSDVTASVVTPDFATNQGYLAPNSPSNNGIDAEKSWTYPGGNGQGITIYDVEYNWSQTHEDLGAFPILVDPGDSINSPFGDGHGTAVLGELVGDNNGLGVKGISYGANVKVCPERTTNLGGNRGNAILLAVNDGKPGDVILLEMQWWGCGAPTSSKTYGPAEERQDVFDATAVAVANGITVVAAAGNGDIDLDSPSCNGKYDRNVRDSGAIIVGAGGSGRSGNARQKMWFSCYGSRVDVHGWGEKVWTTGYGSGYKDPSDRNNQDLWYTSTFSGTSSASPIVAAAAANIQGIAIQKFGAPLDPIDLRALLRDTGLPQLGGGGNIGPLVNLGSAIDALMARTTPTTSPTASPTKAPTTSPTASPTKAPTTSPTASPTKAPTTSPTASPTKASTISPTSSPTTSSPVKATVTCTSSIGNKRQVKRFCRDAGLVENPSNPSDFPMFWEFNRKLDRNKECASNPCTAADCCREGRIRKCTNTNDKGKKQGFKEESCDDGWTLIKPQKQRKKIKCTGSNGKTCRSEDCCEPIS